ncbi:hypothetical protein J6590_034642 [Homalodisca vitripennis]|nr:hypothetical protein J6590_034642 [Homalodisca vitripennis]
MSISKKQPSMKVIGEGYKGPSVAIRTRVESAGLISPYLPPFVAPDANVTSCSGSTSASLRALTHYWCNVSFEPLGQSAGLSNVRNLGVQLDETVDRDYLLLAMQGRYRTISLMMACH